MPPLALLLPLLLAGPLPDQTPSAARPPSRPEGVAGGVSGRDGGLGLLLVLEGDSAAPAASASAAPPPWDVAAALPSAALLLLLVLVHVSAALLAAVAAVLGVPVPPAGRFPSRSDRDDCGVPNVTVTWAADKLWREPRLWSDVPPVCEVWVVLRLLIVSYVGRYGRLPVVVVVVVAAAAVGAGGRPPEAEAEFAFEYEAVRDRAMLAMGTS